MFKLKLRFSAALLGVLLCANALVVTAQDASQVLRLSVGFRTLKNSVALFDAHKRQPRAAAKAAGSGQ